MERGDSKYSFQAGPGPPALGTEEADGSPAGHIKPFHGKDGGRACWEVRAKDR